MNVPFHYRKITQVLNFFVQKTPEQSIDLTKLVKLTWAADRYHVRKYGHLLTNDEYLAMERGPVGSAVKNIAEESSYLPYDILSHTRTFIKYLSEKYEAKSIKALDTSILSKTDLEALDFSWNNFGQMTPTELSILSHKYPEWKRHEAVLVSKNVLRKEINPEDFFRDPENLKQDKFAMDSELLELSKELFLEQRHFAGAAS